MSSSNLLIISLIMLTSFERLAAQCDEVISFEAYPTAEGVSTGKIELKFKEPSRQAYDFKLYRISEQVELIVEVNNEQVKDRVVFTALSEGDYIVKVERDGCQVEIGGIEGIEIARKEK